MTLTTDESGRAATADDALPYGEYVLHESATNESMLLTAPDQTVNVTDDGIIYEFTMADEVVRGGVLIEKRDLESGLLTPLGGASLDGTLFEITNQSKNAVYVGGALYQPGEVCAAIEVVDGIAQTDTGRFPMALTKWWRASLGRVTSIPIRLYVLSKSARTGRSSSFEMAMQPITRSFAATSSL